MRKAVIDVGSNSVLLLVAEKTDTGWQTITETSAVTGLGEGTKATGLLSERGMTDTLAAIKTAFEKAHELGAEQVVAAATMAARIASNTPEFQARGEAQGTPIVVLSGDEEARLGFLAVANDPTFSDQEILSIVDVGGQSTELVTAKLFSESSSLKQSLGEDHRDELGESARRWGTNSDHPLPRSQKSDPSPSQGEGMANRQTTFHKSFPVGTLALRATHLANESPSGYDLLKATAEIDKLIGVTYLPGEGGVAVALGATGTNLVTIRDRILEWDPEQVHGQYLTYEEVSKAVSWLCSMTDAERAAIPGIEKGRERSIHIGALLLERFLFAIRVEGCAVSVRGWRHALLEELG